MKRNYGGVEAAQPEEYKRLIEGHKEEIKVDSTWWSNSKTNFLLVAIFSLMDGMVLFSIFDECLTQSALMGIVMAFGVAVVLNVLPLIIAKFVHHAMYKTKKNAKTMLSIFLLGFCLIYGGTVLLRFAYRDMYGQEKNSVQLENTVSNEEVVTEEDELEAIEQKKVTERKSLAVVILLSLSPLVTSIIAYGIAYVGDDEIRKMYEYLKKRRYELDEAISDVEAAIDTINIDLERDLYLDECMMNAAIKDIEAKTEYMKAVARQCLAEYLADPSISSRVLQEMLDNNDTGENLVGNTDTITLWEEADKISA